MTEATIVRKIIDGLKRQLTKAVIFKHVDLMTAGIPDLSINFNGRTTWVEVKLLCARETWSQFNKHFNRLQLAKAQLLEQQCPTYYLIAYPSGGQLQAVIIRPERLARLLECQVFNTRDFQVPAEYHGNFIEGLDHLVFLARGG